MAQIIDGKAVSAKVKEQIRKEAAEIKKQGIEIGLAVVIVGNDPALHLMNIPFRKKLRKVS